jgi:hypothetical protein
MKTKWLSVAVFASVGMIAQANPAGFHARAGAFHGGAIAHSAPAVHAPMRPGGFSSFHSTPMRAYGSRPLYSGQRYSSFGMRSYRPTGFRQPSIYRDRVTFTRSGPFTAATIRQANQSNRFPRFASYRNQRATSVWNQRNGGSQFRNGNNVRNGNNRLRGDWQKHVFARHSGDWHRDWNHHSDHWWNGHQCCFINGSWVIFNSGFDPWWPYAYYPDSYAYGSPYYGGYDYPNSSGYDSPYSYDYQPGDYDSGDYQGQQYYDQNSYPDQSQGYYDSGVYQTESYDDQNRYDDQSTNSIVVRAQERLAREGFYHGESDGGFGPEMRQALRSYQSSRGLPTTGYLDKDTVAAMGLR